MLPFIEMSTGLNFLIIRRSLFFILQINSSIQGLKRLILRVVRLKYLIRRKTNCDCIRLRNKVGTDVVKEAMQNYLKREDKNISKRLYLS